MGHGDGDLWQCELLVPACVDCGDWQLEQVTLQDKANNLVNVRIDNPLVRAVQLNIAGDNCDSNAPVMQGLVLNTNDLVVGREGATLTVTVTAFDDACGISGVSGQYGGPGAGSVSNAAAAHGRECGIAVIDGGCPCMFDSTATSGHKTRRVLFTATGHVPKQI